MLSTLTTFVSRLLGHTIARRLSIGFGILVILLVVMGVGSLFAQNTIDLEISRVVDTAFRISTLTTEIQNKVNELRVEFGEFLIEYQQGAAYDETWASVASKLAELDEVRERIAELRIIAETTDKDHLNQIVGHLNLIDATIAELETAVPAIAEDLRSLGNNASTGLTGQLLQNLEQFRSLSAGSGMIRVESTALEAFRPPLSYLVEPNDTHVTEFQAIVAEFEGVVSTSALPQARETELMAGIITVDTTFDQIVALRGEIDEGIVSLDTITGNVEPALAALSEVAAIELDEAIQGFERVQQAVLVFKVVVMVVGITVGVTLALSIVRSISEPLGRLVWVTQRVGDGDLNQRAHLRTHDEFGRLGMAFDQMVSQLQENMSNQVARERVESVVSQYRDVISRVAQGDLTARLELETVTEQPDMSSDDLYQLGIYLNVMVDNLRDMTSQIRDTASAVARAVTEIEAATTQQLATTSEQDAAITQTMATVEEVRTTVSQMANRAQQVAQSSRQSVTASKQGEEIVLDTISGMETIQMRVNDIAETILSLSERTQQIGEIIDTVNHLAEQSKLLALNASIEAARAGEEGRGFAVVAMEVRQLAEQSREATNRVHSILNEIQQATNTAVMVTEEGSKGAVAGMSLVERAGDTIRELGNVLEEALQAATQIAASTHQQTSGMDQLAAAMAQIQQASAQAAASADQTEQNVRNIVTMSQQLEEAAARYQL